MDAKEFKELARDISILYVEDDKELGKNTHRLLSTLFEEVDTAENGISALEKYNTRSYDIVMTDIHMPGMDGIQLVKAIKQVNEAQPIIITSAHDESRYLLELIKLGVNDFALKPLDISQLLTIFSKVIKFIKLIRMEKEYTKNLEETVAKRTQELKNALNMIQDLSSEMVFRLTAASEYRDVDTGQHINRVGSFARLLAGELGMDKDFIESITFAAPLHDIGKIGIPDSILLKQGPLSLQEFEIMKTHTAIGASILSGSLYYKINMIEKICMEHHERYDGTGYPRELKGDAISLEGQIVNICDQYDALRSNRPYKPGFDHERTLSILVSGDGRTKPEHFNPLILEIFKKNASRFNEIYNTYKD